nr:MAG TPA: hypothetical protein [Inoviridae sp.]
MRSTCLALYRFHLQTANSPKGRIRGNMKHLSFPP